MRICIGTETGKVTIDHSVKTRHELATALGRNKYVYADKEYDIASSFAETDVNYPMHAFVILCITLLSALVGPLFMLAVLMISSIVSDQISESDKQQVMFYNQSTV